MKIGRIKSQNASRAKVKKWTRIKVKYHGAYHPMMFLIHIDVCTYIIILHARLNIHRIMARWIMTTRISALSTETLRGHQRTPRPIEISKKCQVNLRISQDTMETRNAMCAQDGFVRRRQDCRAKARRLNEVVVCMLLL